MQYYSWCSQDINDYNLVLVVHVLSFLLMVSLLNSLLLVLIQMVRTLSMRYYSWFFQGTNGNQLCTDGIQTNGVQFKWYLHCQCSIIHGTVKDTNGNKLVHMVLNVLLMVSLLNSLLMEYKRYSIEMVITFVKWMQYYSWFWQNTNGNNLVSMVLWYWWQAFLTQY